MTAERIIPIQTVILAIVGIVVILGIARHVWTDPGDK